MIKNTRSTCPYCGVGCGVIIESDGQQITHVRGDPDHPANAGRLCTKGSTLHLTAAPHVQNQARLLSPLRRTHRHAPALACDWHEALDTVADRLAHTVRTHGPDAVGFYISGQLLTEDYYVFNKLAKGLIGTNNIDTNSRLCMSSAVSAYKATLGADAPPSCYADLDHAQTVFIAGSNMAYAHPILFRRLEEARTAHPAMKLIVVDPRRTATAEVADLHLQILPGTDVTLFHGMLHVMLRDGLIDRPFIDKHTEGFDRLQQSVQVFTPKDVAQVCGISENDLQQAAHWFGQHTPTLSLYCQGLNQSSSGTDKNVALINLHLATGQIGYPGAGPLSLTGQPNAMGGREVGGMATLLSGHRDLHSAQHRREVAALWGIPSVPSQPGHTAVDLFRAAADGRIKALWIVCTNPAQSLPNQHEVRQALERCEFVVLQESFAQTATSAYADIQLPASTWGEKDGTVTNSERCISRVRPAVAAPGQARHDWRIAVDVARRLEQQLPITRSGNAASLFPYEEPAAIWNEHRESTRGRDLDITGLSYTCLDTQGPQQWPYREGSQHGTVRLYTDRCFATPNGRARFKTPAARSTAQVRDARYPFSLTTGRLRDQWHGMSRTGTLGRLFGHVPEPVVEMNPQDMQRLHLTDGDLVQVQSRHGMLILPAQAHEGIAICQAFVAMHWGEEVLSGKDINGRKVPGINTLMPPDYCPQSHQPELKHAAVSITPASLPWHVLAMAWLPQDRVLTVRQALSALLRDFAFACVVPFGREPSATHELGLLLRAANPEAPADATLRSLETLLDLQGDDILRYSDPHRGQHRAMRLSGSGESTRLSAFVLAGDTRAQSWVRTLLQEQLPAQAYGWRLLLPSDQAPVHVPARGKQVCSCLNVNEVDIQAALRTCVGQAQERLTQLQDQLRCGTQCGSCIPELRKLIADTQPSFTPSP